MTKQTSNLRHMGFAFIRMPTLPIHDWAKHANSAWTCGNRELAWQRRADSGHVLFHRSNISEAIHIASIGFHKRLTEWDWIIRSKDDRKMLTSFERYFNRMCFRSTPFGMFSTVSYAHLKANQAWTLDKVSEDASIERAIRIDGEALNALCERINNEPDPATRYAVNASLYRIGDRYRFTDWKIRSNLDRHYELSEINHHPVIESLIARIDRKVLTVLQIKDLCAEINMVEEIDLHSLIKDLIEAKVLISNVSLDPLNMDPTLNLASILNECTAHEIYSERLREIDAQLKNIGSENPLLYYARLDKQIRELTGSDPKRMAIQVDAFRKSDNFSINSNSVSVAVEAINYLSNYFNYRIETLDAFCDEFTKQYGSGTIPLMEALDNEAGIGYQRNALPNNLLHKVGIKRKIPTNSNVVTTSFDQFLLILIQKDPNILIGREIKFTRKDMLHLAMERRGIEPSGMQLSLSFPMMRNAAGNRERTTALAGIVTGGPMNWMSRFCYGDDGLHQASRDYAKMVETESGAHVIHAEVSYLPAARQANVLTRPRIWTYRINLVDPSVVAGEYDINISDLMLSVNGKSIQLWSRRFGKRVIPHLTTAHNANLEPNLPAYKFLSALQNHGVRAPKFGWGPMFQSFAYRPRLVFEELVLVPARWRVKSASFEALVHLTDQEQRQCLRDVLLTSKIPSRIELEDQDNTLVLDLEDEIDFEQLLRYAKKGRELNFSEVLEDFDADGLEDGNLSWRHEIVVPVHNAENRETFKLQTPFFQRDLIKVPISEVVYIKFYGGAEAIDSELLTLMLEWLTGKQHTGLINQWFFIRYSDPDWHLRLRIFPAADRHDQVISEIIILAERMQLSKIISRYELCPYEREIIRYGGNSGISASESLFCIDSELICAMLTGPTFSGARPTRWAMAMLSINALLTDFGLCLQTKFAIMTSLSNAFKHEFSVTKEQAIRLGAEHRQHARWLLKALGRSNEAPTWSKELHFLLDASSTKRRRAAALIVPTKHATPDELSIVSNHVHMLCNRLFPEQGREHEVLVYDYLMRSYRSMLAMSE
ncbi:lantibiotic dehydratase [Janthinobacterium sp. NFX145]|uniref:lantibiotic dehydratase n=1 Tax=Janthinobacterium sp. NFX145 TaxID=3415602 RepID=UPI003CC5DA63